MAMTLNTLSSKSPTKDDFVEAGIPPKTGSLRIRMPRWAIAASIVVLLTLIAYIDLVTPTQLSLALFYLLPVAAATWLLDRRAGYAMAVIAAATWLWVELHDNSQQTVPIVYLNALSRLGFFCFQCRFFHRGD